MFRHSHFGGTYVVQNMKAIGENQLLCHKPYQKIEALNFGQDKVITAAVIDMKQSCYGFHFLFLFLFPNKGNKRQTRKWSIQLIFGFQR